MKLKKIMAAVGLLGFFVLGGMAFANSSEDVGSIATKVTSSFWGVGQLLVAGSYVAGFSLVLVALFKFKGWRDNPSQTTLGIPIALLAIGVMLVFLPTILGSGGKTVFGDTGQAGSFGGSGYEIDLNS